MVKAPSRREWMRFHFRLYALGCGLAVLAVSVLVVVVATTGWRSETRLVLSPGATPPALKAELTDDGALPPPVAEAALAFEKGGETRNHARRTVTLQVPEQGDLPERLEPLLTRRYKSMAAAYRDAEREGVEAVLFSVDALLEKAATVEEGVLLGLERLFVHGAPAAAQDGERTEILPLAHFLAALDQAVVAAAAADEAQAPPATAIVEARAYLAVSLRFVERDAPVPDEARLAEAKEQFLSVRLLSEPRGLWAANAQRRREYRALRALMYPLEPQVAAALRNALAYDREHRDGTLYAHYTRWLAFLEALYGYHTGPRTVASMLSRDEPPQGPVSLLPVRAHEPADVHVLASDLLSGAEDRAELRAAARTTVADRGGNADVAALQRKLARLMLGEAEAAPGPRDANWRRLRLWARVPQLPGAMHEHPEPYSAAYKLRTSAAYKRLRLGGGGPRGQEETVRGVEVFGRPLLGWRPREEEREAALLRPPSLRMEPAPEVLHRLHMAAHALPELLASAGLERSLLRRTRTVGPDGRERADNVLGRLAAARDLFGALYVLEARSLGIRPEPLSEWMPSQSALADADAWLSRGGFRRDVDLDRDVRGIWPLYTGADALVCLGVRGVTLEPVALTLREDGDATQAGSRHLALVAVADRQLHASDSHVLPTQEMYRLAAPRLPADWLRALIQ